MKVMFLLICSMATHSCWRGGWLWIYKLWNIIFFFPLHLRVFLLPCISCESIPPSIGLYSSRLVTSLCRKSQKLRLSCFCDSVLGGWKSLDPVCFLTGWKEKQDKGPNTIPGSLKRLRHTYSLNSDFILPVMTGWDPGEPQRQWTGTSSLDMVPRGR